jgi:hypothetical protein
MHAEPLDRGPAPAAFRNREHDVVAVLEGGYRLGRWRQGRAAEKME